MHEVVLIFKSIYVKLKWSMSQPELSFELRNYLSSSENSLIDEGIHLMYEAKNHFGSFRDFSFVVFPFAKAYEGFLKRIFFDLGFISNLDYKSKHFRIGKVMSPNLQRRLRNKSVYKKICDKVNCEIADAVWNTWKVGRNEIFHYYTSGVRMISIDQAEDTIELIIATMEQTYRELRMDKVQQRLSTLIKEKTYHNSLN